MGPISREQLHMGIAELISKRSTCQRGHVGAILTRNNRIVSSGYNGPIAGAPPCKGTCNIEEKCSQAVHAEHNAILAAAKEGIPTNLTVLWCTTMPCFDCAKAIIQAGIREVYYMNEYRSKEGLLLLKDNGVIVKQILPPNAITS